MDQQRSRPVSLSNASTSDTRSSAGLSNDAPAIPPLQIGQSRSLGSVWQNTLQSRTAVLATLFLVTGAIGLPLLWYSPVFSRFEKFLWSLMTVMYTSALIGVTWAIVYWCYQLVMGTLSAS